MLALTSLVSDPVIRVVRASCDEAHLDVLHCVGAMRVAEHLGPGHRIVTVLCDTAGRYSQKLYNPQFLHEQGLPSPPWLEGGSDRVEGDSVLNQEHYLSELISSVLEVTDEADEATE